MSKSDLQPERKGPSERTTASKSQLSDKRKKERAAKEYRLESTDVCSAVPGPGSPDAPSLMLSEPSSNTRMTPSTPCPAMVTDQKPQSFLRTGRVGHCTKPHDKSRDEGQSTLSQNQSALQPGSRRSLIVTLKVPVLDSALQSGQYRRTYDQRQRKPTEKARENHELAVQGLGQFKAEHILTLQKSTRRSASARPGESQGKTSKIVRGNVTPKARGRPRKSNSKTLTKASRKRPKTNDDDDDYQSKGPKRRGRKSLAALQTGPSRNNGLEIIRDGDNDDDMSHSDKLTKIDFEASSTFGFPMRVVRIPDKTGQLHTFVAPRDQGKLTDLNTLVLPSPVSTEPSVLPENEGTAGQTRQKAQDLCQGRRGFEALIRSKAMPNTPQFCMDQFLAQRAYDSDDIDMKMLCLNLMRAHANSWIPKITVEHPLAKDTTFFFGTRICRSFMADDVKEDHVRGQTADPGDSGVLEARPLADIVPPYGINSLKHPDDPSILLTYTDWDLLLASIRIARNTMRRGRVWKMEEKFREAGWAIWECRMRRLSRGSFVEVDNDHEDDRDGEGNIIKTVGGMGYRRVGVDMGDGILDLNIAAYLEIAQVSRSMTQQDKMDFCDDQAADNGVGLGISDIRTESVAPEDAILEAKNADVWVKKDVNSARRRLFTPTSLMEID